MINNPPPRLLHFGRSALGLLLLPASLLAGCTLYQPPLYARVEPAPGATRILFIGNSLTYYNDLPGLLQQFSARESRPAHVESATFPYASLDYHWKKPALHKRITDGNWDCIVLQDFSTRAVDHPADAVESFRRFGQLATDAGARPVIFENWTRRRRPSDGPALDETYAQVRDTLHGTLAPIGEAWRLCHATHADIRLWKDDRHPTVAGTYLAACILYRTLYHKPAVGLPTAIPGLKLSSPTAATLQQIADQTEASPHI